jgi:hypothetical protein
MNKICVRCGVEYPNHKMSCKIPVEEWRLPTAEEFALKDGWEKVIDHLTIKRMQEFAKLHLEAQKEAILENVKTDLVEDVCPITGQLFEIREIDKNSIKNAYPLNNVK